MKAADIRTDGETKYAIRPPYHTNRPDASGPVTIVSKASVNRRRGGVRPGWMVRYDDGSTLEVISREIVEPWAEREARQEGARQRYAVAQAEREAKATEARARQEEMSRQRKAINAQAERDLTELRSMLTPFGIDSASFTMLLDSSTMYHLTPTTLVETLRTVISVTAVVAREQCVAEIETAAKDPNCPRQGPAALQIAANRLRSQETS